MNKTNNKLVSVVLPSYNHARFVQEAIDSVLTQTYPDIELIIVDDGSDDNSRDVISKISDTRIKTVFLEENRAVHPRNLGISMAQGDYIAFQNSDDVWSPKKLEKQIDHLEKHGEVVACFTGIKTINRKGKESWGINWAKGMFKNTNRTSNEWLRFFFEEGNCVCLSSAMVRRSVVETVGGFDESLVQLGDMDLWVRMASQGEFYIINESLTSMRVFWKANLSAPSLSTFNRARLEYARLLAHYGKPFILPKLKNIFPEYVEDNDSPTIVLVSLLRYAWTRKTVHRLFATQLFANLINDHRKEIIDYFGPSIMKEFIRAQKSIFMKKI